MSTVTPPRALYVALVCSLLACGAGGGSSQGAPKASRGEDAGSDSTTGSLDGSTESNPPLGTDGASLPGDAAGLGSDAVSTLGDGSTAGDGPTAVGDGAAMAVDAGSNPILSQSYASGSRIKAQWDTTADGAQQFAGWVDTQTNTGCVFVAASDGVVRCLPTAAYPQVVFGDSACTEPAGTSATCLDGAPAAIASTDWSACPHRTDIYAVGATVAGMLYSTDGFGVCTSEGTLLATAYAAGAAQPASDFVPATYSSGPDVAGIIPVYVNGMDGSFGFDHWVDAATQAACAFNLAEDSQYHCLPNFIYGAAEIDYFVDSACTTSAMLLGEPGCAAPAYGVNILSVTCGIPAYQVYAVGSAAAPTVYAQKKGSCAATTVPNGDSLYPAGAAVPAATLAGATLQQGASASRLQEYDYVTASGYQQPRAISSLYDSYSPVQITFYDTQLDVDCTVGYAADGSLRCLPVAIPALSGGGSGVFSDSACTQPIAQQALPGCSATPQYANIAENNQCPIRQRFLQVGAKINLKTATLYAMVNGTCQQTTFAGDGLAAYETGAAVPSSTFELVTQMLR